MSRFQKIFLASAFVVVGFGVAKFLGQPVLPTHVPNSRSVVPLAYPVVIQSAAATASAPQTAGGVRLLPDSPMTHSSAPATNVATAMPEPPRLGNTLAPVLAANDRAINSTISRDVDFGPISSALIGESSSSRARLRNEAPRSVGIDPQSPAAIRRVPTENVEVSDPYKFADTRPAPSTWSAPQLLNTGYTESSPSPPTAVPASYTAPVNPPIENQVAPPPWPALDESAEARTHIVVDGDSLERLAGRYLSDPKRSREIFELNRETLSAPDLLPIGAELKIPQRLASASSDRRGFQPNSANAIPSGNVRPASASQGIIPRAQLAPPVMVQ